MARAFLRPAELRYNAPQTKDPAVMRSGRLDWVGCREPRGWDAVPIAG